jgi:NADH-quinone oxidoreductase subunit E
MFHLQLCDNVSCMLCRSNDLLGHLEAVLGIKKGGTTPDGMFTLSTVECLGACEMAPVMQIGDDYYGNLDIARIDTILYGLRAAATQATTIDRAAAGPPGE